ncbi:SGNH/GDSL hydrolase family protein [Saccharothrix sp. NPDC042600]|uniref:SGNH/GDSL hydrolase family protein n=1 Tax=Saccharothrix TaxID=2071 RepID=UPI0033E27492|nr:SGNH/GDSL hydrolase family protein [Saccharothrix mutabilis subsp. capreolus]
MRRLLPVLLAALSITWTGTAAAAAPAELEYVALGDSAAAGPLIPAQELMDLGCLRSTRNWPSVLAARVGATTFRDVSCSGATTDHLATSQSTFTGPQPPQLDALTPTTDLVTITIGGNDIGLVGVALGCVNVFPEPLGVSCKDRLTAGGDQIAAKIDAYAAEFAAGLDAVKARAPRAEVVVVGYGTYVRPGGCHPKEPIWARDADYLQGSVHRLNTVLGKVSADRGATFVDIEPPSVGHDVCAPVTEKWFEGLVPTSVAAPLHPNARGMAGIGAFIAGALGVSRL